jgi:hypothetical protein
VLRSAARGVWCSVSTLCVLFEFVLFWGNYSMCVRAGSVFFVPVLYVWIPTTVCTHDCMRKTRTQKVMRSHHSLHWSVYR